MIEKGGMDMRELEDIRRELDSCDEELARLLERRMDLIRELTAEKKAKGLPQLKAKGRRQKGTLISRLEASRYGRECRGSPTASSVPRRKYRPVPCVPAISR